MFWWMKLEPGYKYTPCTFPILKTIDDKVVNIRDYFITRFFDFAIYFEIFCFNDTFVQIMITDAADLT